MCFRKRNKIYSPKKELPPPVQISPKNHKKKLSEDLKIAISNYRKEYPKIMILSSPNNPLRKYETTFSPRTF